MIDKKEFLLESIIKAYIINLEPIGSSQLKQMYDLEYSSATIRGYFKKLGDEGYLVQEHISSGRVPSVVALRQYWSTRLNRKLENVDLQSLQYFAKEIGLSVALKKEVASKLLKVVDFEQAYIVLRFDDFAVTIKYSSALYKFLQDFIGLDIEQIMSISKQVGAFELYNELVSRVYGDSYQTINVKEYIKMALGYGLDDNMINGYFNGRIFDNLKEGIYFDTIVPKGYIGICDSVKIDGEDSKMLVIGDLSKNYNYFYERVAA